MVMRLSGNSKLAFSRALLTLSLLSLTAASGKPTILKAGKPLDRCASTETRGASMPIFALVYTTASDIPVPQRYPTFPTNGPLIAHLISSYQQPVIAQVQSKRQFFMAHNENRRYSLQGKRR